MKQLINHIKIAWSSYKKNFVTIALVLIIIGIINMVLSGFAMVSLLGPENYSDFAMSYFYSGSVIAEQNYETIFELNPPSIESFALAGIFIIIAILISVILQSGLWGIYLESIKGKPHFKIFFEYVKTRGFRYLLANFLLMVIFIPILLLFILPGIIFPYDIFIFLGFIGTAFIILIIPLFIMTYPTVISGKSVTEALRTSFEIGKKNYHLLLSFLVFSILISLLLYAPTIYLETYELYGVYYTEYSVVYLLESLLSAFLIVPILLLTLSSIYIEVSGSKKPVVKQVIRKKPTKKVARKKSKK